MKHYQLNKYKYDNSKGEIPPVNSRRPSGHYRLFCNSPPCRQANHNCYKVFSHEWDDKQSRPVSAPAGERITVIQTIIRKLEENLEKLNRIIERFDLLRRGYSSEDIIMEFRCTEKENTLFIFMENLIERLCQLNHIGTAKNYHTALGSFK